METPLLPLRGWLSAGVGAVLLHVGGALVIDGLAWKLGLAYEVLAGQFLLLAGGVWFLLVAGVFLVRLRRWGYLDPVRIFLWVVSVAVASAPLKAIGERLMEPFLKSAYDAYPEKHGALLRAYLKRQGLSPEKVEELVTQKIRLFEAYRVRQSDVGRVLVDRVKVLGVLGVLYGLILGLLLRGGGTDAPPGPGPKPSSAGSAGSS